MSDVISITTHGHGPADDAGDGDKRALSHITYTHRRKLYAPTLASIHSRARSCGRPLLRVVRTCVSLVRSAWRGCAWTLHIQNRYRHPRALRTLLPMMMVFRAGIRWGFLIYWNKLLLRTLITSTPHNHSEMPLVSTGETGIVDFAESGRSVRPRKKLSCLSSRASSLPTAGPRCKHD